MSDWQTIDGAPKDGTRFDAWIVPPEGSHIHAAPFRAPDARFENEDGEFWLVDRNHNIIDWQEPGKQYASHWMPLPPPPEVA